MNPKDIVDTDPAPEDREVVADAVPPSEVDDDLGPDEEED